MAAEPPRRRPHRIVSIVGTRPEAIKMAPVVRELARRRRLEQELVLTGQHSGLARQFELPPHFVSELQFDPRGRTAPRLRESLHNLLCGHFRHAQVDLVLVHGDTASAIAGAFAARDCGLPIGHVEAGLRSGDLKQPWPEEGNRLVVDTLAALLFAPTDAAAANLARDWRVKGEVVITGNTGIDQLFHVLDASPPAKPQGPRPMLLVTCHRKENAGEPVCAVARALRRLAAELPLDIAVALHPNRHVRAEIEPLLAGVPNLALLEPLEHADMVRLLARSWLVLTDSGGLQEEAPALGKPVLVLRNVTERGEAVESANVELVGTDEERIVETVKRLHGHPDLYARMARPSLPFGDGHAAPRIVDAIEVWLRRCAPAPPSPPPASAGRPSARAPRRCPPAARSARRGRGSGR